MSAHAIPHGRHERHGLSTVPVAVRHFLLWLLPIEQGSPDTWRTVWIAFGEVVEDFFALFVIFAALVMVAITFLFLAWLSLQFALAVAALAVLGVLWRRVLVAARRLERAVDEEAPR